MLQNESQKAWSKESKFQNREYTSKVRLKEINKLALRIAQKGSSPSVSLKQVITHTKGHCGWKNPNQFLKLEEAIKEDSNDECY